MILKTYCPHSTSNISTSASASDINCTNFFERLFKRPIMNTLPIFQIVFAFLLFSTIRSDNVYAGMEMESELNGLTVPRSSRPAALDFKKALVCKQPDRPIYHVLIENEAGETFGVAFPGSTGQALKFKECLEDNRMSTTREDFLEFAADHCVPHTPCRPLSSTTCQCPDKIPPRCVFVSLQHDLRKCAEESYSV